MNSHRLSIGCGFLLWVFFLNGSAYCQTLAEKLIAENPEKLAQQAREDGNIIRGAILFHQGNINCAKCHRATSTVKRLGPDLTRMESSVTEKHLVESILQPSKVLHKDFAGISILKLDGETINGMVFKEDKQQVILRDRNDIDRLITIPRSEIDEIQPDKVSMMPDDLANELKSRKQFLDLLRYVLDLKENGARHRKTVADGTTKRALDAKLQAMVAIGELNCAACHKSENVELVSKQAPRLKFSAKWSNPDYIESFIANPHGVKPGTTMPALLAHFDEKTRRSSAKALTHFLISKTKSEYKAEKIDAAAITRGNELFHSVGCVACHSPRDAKAVEQPMRDSKSLGALERKYSISGLTKLLEDPLAVRRSGHMPDMRLTYREANDIANFLLQTEPSQSKDDSFELDGKLVEQGKKLFSELGCSNCHDEVLPNRSPPSEKLALNKLDPSRGCLSTDKGDWPDYKIDEVTRQLLQKSLKELPARLTANQKIDVALTRFNCIACHDRNQLGGVSIERNPHFQTSDLNLGDQGRIPPGLSGAGAKLKPKWMRDVLVNGRKIRPYMKTRMPQYGKENVEYLVELFQSVDKLDQVEFAKFKDQKKTRQFGLQLAGNKGLNCVACHTYKYKLSDTMPAVDLTEMAERLKKDWFYEYMLDPQRFSPNTVMPSFWPGGVAIRNDIEGMPKDQVEALWQYLVDGRLAGTPAGVVREPLEIVVSNEAQMLRRSYQGIGKRGIGVGYPGGVNIAFDAEQMRLGMIWQGRFADPSGVWRGQGSGTVRPMSRPVNFAKGPEFDSKAEPWKVDDGRPPKHKFKGYTLDKKRRPTFRYVYDGIEVNDYFRESKQDDESIRIRRELSFAAVKENDGLRFRLGSGAVDAIDKKSFSLGNGLKLRILSDHEGQVVDPGDGKQIWIELKLKPKNEDRLIIEYFWDQAK